MTWIEQLAEMGSGERNVYLSHDPKLGYCTSVFEGEEGVKGWLAGPTLASTFEGSVAQAHTMFQRTMRNFYPDDPLVKQWDGEAG